MSPYVLDRSRDRRIEDPTNLWIIHPAARWLLPAFLSRGVSANAVSVGGLGLGVLAAIAFANWRLWPFAFIGLLLSIAWLVADGLDGMIARATGTASPLGRLLDGLCDHGVFLMLYVALVASMGTIESGILAACAGVVHAVQSNFYESERARFHRRSVGIATVKTTSGGIPLLRIYDKFAGLVDRLAPPFDEVLERHPMPERLGAAYGIYVAKPLRLMSLLSANVRVYAVFAACLARDPSLFWWFELLPMTAILLIGLYWRGRVESRLAGYQTSSPSNLT